MLALAQREEFGTLPVSKTCAGPWDVFATYQGQCTPFGLLRVAGHVSRVPSQTASFFQGLCDLRHTAPACLGASWHLLLRPSQKPPSYWAHGWVAVGLWSQGKQKAGADWRCAAQQECQPHSSATLHAAEPSLYAIWCMCVTQCQCQIPSSKQSDVLCAETSRGPLSLLSGEAHLHVVHGSLTLPEVVLQQAPAVQLVSSSCKQQGQGHQRTGAAGEVRVTA